MFPAKYRLIGVLCGLVGALGANPKTVHTDRVVLDALALFHRLPEDDSPETLAAVKAGIAAIRREKFTIVPGCAVCQSPCANTADYDMQQLFDAQDALKDRKLHLLELLGNIACKLLDIQLSCNKACDVPNKCDGAQQSGSGARGGAAEGMSSDERKSERSGACDDELTILQAVSFIAWEADPGYLDAMAQLLEDILSAP